MAATHGPVNFDSPENVILLNPRLPPDAHDSLRSLALRTQQERGLQGHVWFSTSGSTAESAQSVKLVALSKAALLASAQAVNAHFQVTAQDKWTQVLPHFHVGGFGIEARAYLSGSSVVPALKEGRWEVDYFYTVVQEQGCTLSALVPTQVYDLVMGGYQAPASLRAIVVGGGVLEKDLFAKARALGWPVLPSYGMTETASQIATGSLASLRETAYPAMELLPHAQARTNEEGFLEVAATSLLTCYAQNIDGEPRSWDPKVSGWLTTEDQGDVRGKELFISGRKKDYIKIGGEATNMARLRGVLETVVQRQNPAWSLRVTLVNVPSDRLGSEVHLVSSLNANQTQELLEAFTKDVLPFEKPRKIYYVDEIPRSTLGKILWGELRRKL